MKLRIMRWVEHTARIVDMRNAFLITERKWKRLWRGLGVNVRIWSPVVEFFKHGNKPSGYMTD
jgi:hypothetical protein